MGVVVPVTLDDFVQENTGAPTTTTDPYVVTLPSGTTAGNTVVVILSYNNIPTPPAGFVTVMTQNNLGVFYKSNVGAAETSWSFDPASASYCAWYVAEVSNLDPVDPVDASASLEATPANGGTHATGTAPLGAGLSTVALAAWTVAQAGGFSHGFGSFTNSFDFVAEAEPGATLDGRHLTVARKFVDGTTTSHTSTATYTTTFSGNPTVWGAVVSLRAADSPIVAPLAGFMGFEWGTHGGWGNPGDTGGLNQYFLGANGTMGTNYIVQAGSARNGSYGLRIVQTGANHFSPVFNIGTKAAAYGFNVRVVSATGTPVVFEVVTAVGDNLQLVYNSSTTKFGLRWGTGGSVAYESATTALNTWRWIDIRLKVSTSTWHADWRIETAASTYTAQSSPTDPTGQDTTSNLIEANLGGDATQTLTTDWDDVCASRYYSAYPLGPHKVVLLKVDPAGTPAVVGTSGNFSVFTANGTLAAWNATNARNAIDEVPPTISASADGVCQTATAATNYMEFTMETYTCTSTEAIAGVRMVAAAWGGTGTGTGTLAIKGFTSGKGTTELDPGTTSYDAGSPTAISATVPYWLSGAWNITNGWTQANLNGAALLIGYSTDATPDMGVHAAYLEVAIGKTKRRNLFGTIASLEADPHRLGTVSITVDAPAGVDTNLTYEVGGSPTTMNVAGGASDTDQVNATFEPDVNYISGETEAEPDPVD